MPKTQRTPKASSKSTMSTSSKTSKMTESGKPIQPYNNPYSSGGSR